MRICKSSAQGMWLGIFTLILLSNLSVASPLFPDVRAARSRNGSYLVVVEQTFDNPDPSVVRRVLSSTYVVLKSESFINSRDRLQTSGSFWSNFGWQVNLSGKASQRVSLPLISDDGQTLILVLARPAMKGGDQEVLQIYRRQENTGKLVRTLRLTDIWTHEEIESAAVLIDMGETPMWYTDGLLEFSADDQELLYHSRWNDLVRIKLADGSTTTERK